MFSPAGKPVYAKPRRLTPVCLRFLSPGEVLCSPPGSSHPPEFKDIVGGLIRSGIPKLARDILYYLSPIELFRCRLICQEWDEFISMEDDFVDRIAAYKSHINTTTSQGSRPSSKPLPRPALSLVTNILQTINEPSPVPTMSRLYLETLPKNIKLRPCPNCASPAKKLNLRRAECTNANCLFDFCMNCFKFWHEENCLHTGDDHLHNVSKPMKRSSILIAGSSKSKKRLRRL